MKLPPTLTLSVVPRISSRGRQSHAAAWFLGDLWTASSTYGGGDGDEVGEESRGAAAEAEALDGVDVIVKPPAFGTEGMYVSTHWPGRNCTIDEDADLAPGRGGKKGGGGGGEGL